MSDDKNNISSHILPTSANLLGLCFVIFSIVKVNRFGDISLLDEMTAFSMVLFLVSCLFSYASIRAKKSGALYEKIADVFFISGLVFMTLISVIFIFEFVK